MDVKCVGCSLVLNCWVLSSRAGLTKLSIVNMDAPLNKQCLDILVMSLAFNG